jgi:protein-S-isoprenylcysteine O-methyltransferase Ste14
MVFRSFLGIAGGLVCACMFLRRIPREEALLAREFDVEWAAYAKRTRRLFPGVY